MKKIILFDIDYTLINTDLLRRTIESTIIKTIGTDVANFKRMQKKYISKLKSSSDFNPEDYVTHLSKTYFIKDSKMKDIFYKPSNLYYSSLYQDSENTLSSLSKSFVLGIFSEGINKFQITKLKQSGLLKYFNNKYLFIFRRKLLKSSLSQLPEKCFIVDDKKSVVETLITKSNHFPIWINRRGNIKHRKIPTIFSLKDVSRHL